MKTMTKKAKTATLLEIEVRSPKEIAREIKGGKIFSSRLRLNFEVFLISLLKRSELTLLGESLILKESDFESWSIKESSKTLVLHLGVPANRIAAKKIKLKTWKEDESLEASTTEAEIDALRESEEGKGGGVGGSDGPVGNGIGSLFGLAFGGDDSKTWVENLDSTSLFEFEGVLDLVGEELRNEGLEEILGLWIGLSAEIVLSETSVPIEVEGDLLFRFTEEGLTSL